MMKEVNPQETSRAFAFEMWMNAPMPMVTFFKTLHVARLVKISKKRGLKFNMLMCYCIGRAASRIKDFYLLPVFKTFVGMDPKEYTHIVRLQKALSFLQHQKSTGINYAQIALASGYADQSHYIREFKKHCGYTPKSLLEMTSPYSDLFTHPV